MEKLFLAVWVFISSIFGVNHHSTAPNISTHTVSSTLTPTPEPTPTCEQIHKQPYTNLARNVVLWSYGCVTLTPSYTPTPTREPIYNLQTPTSDYQNGSDPQQTYQYNEIPTPTFQPIYQPKNITCTHSGDYTYCSDGTSYITNGDSTYINGGANGKSGSCITNGSYTNCSDGSSGVQNGNYGSYYGNGQSGSCFKNGAWTNCSDGSSTYNFNN